MTQQIEYDTMATPMMVLILAIVAMAPLLIGLHVEMETDFQSPPCPLGLYLSDDKHYDMMPAGACRPSDVLVTSRRLVFLFKRRLFILSETRSPLFGTNGVSEDGK